METSTETSSQHSQDASVKLTPDSETTDSVLDFARCLDLGEKPGAKSCHGRKRRRGYRAMSKLDIYAHEESLNNLVGFAEEETCLTKKRLALEQLANNPNPRSDNPSTNCCKAWGRLRPLAVHSLLQAWAARWSESLTALQPICVLEECVLQHALQLFLRYRACQSTIPKRGEAREAQRLAVFMASSWRFPVELAACLWLATKADGNRSRQPSRALLSLATGVEAGALSSVELEILVALSWKVSPLVDSSD